MYRWVVGWLRMINWKGCERKRPWSIVSCDLIFLDVLRSTTNAFSQYSQLSSWYSNQGPPKYEAEVLNYRTAIFDERLFWNIRVTPVPKHHYMTEVSLHAFLMSLDGAEWSASRSGRFLPGESTSGVRRMPKPCECRTSCLSRWNLSWNSCCWMKVLHGPDVVKVFGADVFNSHYMGGMPI
jgi:hypothetical protein